jgi:hypothetical protein
MGTNMFNARILREDVKAAKNYKIEFIRLAFDKFPTKRRDFLMGNADHYEGLDPDNLSTLKKVLGTPRKESIVKRNQRKIRPYKNLLLQTLPQNTLHVFLC